MVSAQKSRTKKRKQIEDEDPDEMPEEVNANSMELAELRAAFEKQYGAPSDSAPVEDDAARKRRKLRERKQKARAQVEAHKGQALDSSVLEGLNADALNATSITINTGSKEENDDDDDENNDENDNSNSNGFRINRNATSSAVRLVEGNIEVHVLGSTRAKDRNRDFIGSFLPTGTGSDSSIVIRPPPSLLTDHARVPYSRFSKQKVSGSGTGGVGKGKPALQFADPSKQKQKKKKVSGKTKGKA